MGTTTGASGSTTLTGGTGADKLIGGSGADTLDGGQGSDFLNAGSGDDVLRYALSDNLANCKDIYIGGSGKDTLVMVLTAEQWQQEGVRSQLFNYLNHLKAVANAKTGEVSSGTSSDYLFSFGTSTLSVQMIEKLQVTVNGRTVLDSTDTTASAPTLSVSAASGNEDSQIDLSDKISAALTDTDGTEWISSVKISGIPAGATLSNAAGNLTVAADGSITLTPAQLAGLAIQPPADSDADFDLSVTATSTEMNGGVTATSAAKTLSVTVNAVADAPTLTVDAASGDEDSAIDLAGKIHALLADTDGSESLTVTLSEIPSDAVLSNDAGDTLTPVGGSITLTAAQMAGLKITPPADSDADFTLQVKATGTEANGGDHADSPAQSLHVTVNAVADQPTLQVTDASGDEDSAIAIGAHISAALTDTDGSETLKIWIQDIPNGAQLTLKDGTVLHPADADTLFEANPLPAPLGSGVLLDAEQLDGLTITPPKDSDAPIELKVGAVSIEQNGGIAGAGLQTLSVTVNAVADEPTLSVDAAAGDEDSSIAIGEKIHAALADTDDSETLAITIAGIPEHAVVRDALGNELIPDNGALTLTPEQLTGLTITPPQDSDANFDLQVSATATEAANGSKASATEQTLTVTVNSVADEPTLEVANTGGDEDSWIPIGEQITAGLTDNDGSETLSVTISGIPDGATLQNADEDVPAPSGGSVTLTAAQLVGLQLLPPADSDVDFDLQVSATATELKNGSSESTEAQTMSVAIRAVADLPTLSVEAAAGNEDTAIAIGEKITAALSDQDDSETLSITLSGIPANATLANDDGDVLTPVGGSLTLQAGQLTGLTITPPADSDADFKLSVSATATEADGGDTSSTPVKELSVTVNAVADAPTLSVSSASGNEDSAILIGSKISAALSDGDSSETLTVTIAGIPSGATLSNADGALSYSGNSITLQAAQLSGLAIKPPANSDADFSLSVTATSTETSNGASASSDTRLLDVTVNAVADAPTLSVSGTAGDANTAIALGSHISAALVDTDNSETLAITISNIPTGATLTNTAGDTLTPGAGSLTLSAAQLTGLAIKPPLNSDADFNLSITATSTETNGGSSASTGPQTLSVTVNTVGTVFNGGGGNDDFAVSLNAGPVTINDIGGGNDSLTVNTSAGTAFSTFNFERVGDDLVLTLVSADGSSTVTVQNHFGSSVGAVETVRFSNGGTAYGYQLGTGGYNLQKDLSGTGQADVVASSALGQSLDGGNGNDLLFGNDGNDTATGGIGNDLLIGGAGNDRLIGGGGNDVLVGGAGSDTFVFNTAPNGSTNVDAIRDFDANGADFIELASGTFGGIGSGGTLNAADFATLAGSGATGSVGSAVNIVYDSSTGNLFYDANGGGADQRVLIATLTGAAGTVDATDFKVA